LYHFRPNPTQLSKKNALFTNPETHPALKRLGCTKQEATDIMEDQGIDNLEELKVG